MNDLIDRKALKEAMYHEAIEKTSDEMKWVKWDSGCWIRYKMFERVLASIPSAQLERKRGRWIQCDRVNHHRFHPDCPISYSVFYCTSCLKENDRVEKYCPNCGAEMEEEECRNEQ